MTPFSLPDPNNQQSITHPTTGETWEFVDGVWQVRTDIDSHTHSEFTNLDGGSSQQIQTLNELVETLQNAIIELNSDVKALEQSTFLILE